MWHALSKSELGAAGGYPYRGPLPGGFQQVRLKVWKGSRVFQRFNGSQEPALGFKKIKQKYTVGIYMKLI
jgi:hypothetical protein